MKLLFLALSIASILLLAGCSKRVWFQGFVEGQKYQCNKLVGRERTVCLESINDDFDRYQQERNEHLKVSN